MVTHVLKDGTVLPDITGHIVKRSEAKAIYDLMEQINQKSVQKKRKLKEKGAVIWTTLK